MRFLVNTLLLAAISLLLVPSASAQISLNDLPAAQGNSRFYGDVISGVKHPSLTLDGFDFGPDNGLGVKQVLEEVYSGDPDFSVLRVYNRLRDLAANNSNFHPTPTNRSNIIANTRRTQARAFMALATYVIEQNGEGQVLSNVPANVDAPGKVAGLR
jgi:hypothetical protein